MLRLPDFGQRAVNFFLPVLFLGARNVGSLCQSFPHGRIQSSLQPGHNPVAHPVARMTQITIARILAPILTDFRK